MEKSKVPYKVETQIATFEGEWTADEIDSGLAGSPVMQTHVAWYEPSPDGYILVTEPQRIQELEATIAK